MVSTRKPTPRRQLRRHVAFLAVAFAALLTVGLYRIEFASAEATTFAVIARQLLDLATDGKQGLVSSVWWGPLPVLLRLPLVPFFNGSMAILPSLIISALFGAASLAFVANALRNAHLGWSRWTVIAAIIVTPGFLASCTDGSISATLLFLSIIALYGLTLWLAHRRFRYLVLGSSAAALLAITTCVTWPWLIVAGILLSADLAMRPAQRGEKGALLLLAALPPVYVLSLWVLGNWLIMGDPVYFLRSLQLAPPATDSGLVTGLPTELLAATGISILVFIAAVVTRTRPLLAMGALGALPAWIILMLNNAGYAWAAAPMQALLMPLAALALGTSAGMLHRPLLRSALGCTPLVVIIALSLMPAADTAAPLATRPHHAPDHGPDMTLVARAVAHGSRPLRISVCGYGAFNLLGPRPAESFIRALDFDLNATRADYPGHDLFVMVQAPKERSATDSIHWKYALMYERGSRALLYHSDWGDWRLFEVFGPESLVIREAP